MAGLGKQLRGVRIARVLKAEGGSIEDMSQIQEVMEPEIKKSKETKSGKIIKDFGRGFKEGASKFVKVSAEVVKDVADVPKKVAKSIKKMEGSETMKKLQKQVRDANIGKFDKEIFYKKFAKGGQAKDTHVTKDGRVAKKGLYYYMNRAKKLGKSKPGKGTVTDKALKASAKTAKK